MNKYSMDFLKYLKYLKKIRNKKYYIKFIGKSLYGANTISKEEK